MWQRSQLAQPGCPPQQHSSLSELGCWVQAQNAAPDLSQLPEAVSKTLASAAKGVDPSRIDKVQKDSDDVEKKANEAVKEAPKARIKRHEIM